jgi:prevent-host-death family protein
MVMFMVTSRTRSKSRVPKTISAAEFKAKCLQLMDLVAQSGDSVTITKRGRPVAVLSPSRPRRRSAYGFLKGRGKILGDIIAPIDVVWDAAK